MWSKGVIEKCGRLRGTETRLPYVDGQGFGGGHVVLEFWDLFWHDTQLCFYDFESPLGVGKPERPEVDRQVGTWIIGGFGRTLSEAPL